MATAIEYGLIAAGISIAIVTAVSGTSSKFDSRWDDNTDKKAAAAACAALHSGDTVVVKDWLRKQDAEYKCSNYPRISYPTFIRFR